MSVRLADLSRPHSTAGVDGVSVVVSAPPDGAMIRHLRADEIAAARAAALQVRRPDTAEVASAPVVSTPMEVSAPAEPEPGLLESLVGGILGFLFG